MNKQGKSKLRHPGVILLILILLFAIPFSIAWLMYKNKDTTGSTTNHGQLINPPFSVALLGLRNEKGDVLQNTASSDRRWIILYFHPGTCSKNCQKGLYNMRQIRVATGKNMNRVEPAILTYQEDANYGRLDRMIQTEYKGTRHFFIKKKRFNSVIQKHVKASFASEPGTIFIVDPLGNVMMVYKPSANPKAIFNDIQRLLKVSQIG